MSPDHAASIAGLMLTTEALVADIKEPDKTAAAGTDGHGGPGVGMGGMYEAASYLHASPMQTW
jgi:chaperonin GroEL